MTNPWLDRTEQLLLIVLSGFLFWGNAVSSISLVLLLLIGAYRGGWKSLRSRSSLVLLAPPVIILAGWLIHGMAEDGVRELQLWPVWIVAIVYFSSSNKSSLFRKSFALLSVAQAFVVLTVFTFSSPVEHSSFAQGFRDAIESIFNVHPTFVSVAWFWAALLFILEFNVKLFQRIWAVTFLVIMASLCGGKMALLAFLFGICTLAILHIEQLRYRVALVSGVVLIASLNIVFNPVLNERFEEIYSVNMKFEEGQSLSSTELRLGIWKCGLETTIDNLIIGVGAGNTRGALEACYEDYNQVEFFDGEYNTHNQFLHFGLSSGILGVVTLILFFGFLVRSGILSKNRQLIIFTFYFMLICLTENYFSRQFGMMFFAFFAASSFFENKSQLSEASKSSS